MAEKGTIIAAIFAGLCGAVLLWLAIFYIRQWIVHKSYLLDQFFATHVPDRHEWSFWQFLRHHDVKDDYELESGRDRTESPSRLEQKLRTRRLKEQLHREKRRRQRLGASSRSHSRERQEDRRELAMPNRMRTLPSHEIYDLHARPDNYARGRHTIEPLGTNNRNLARFSSYPQPPAFPLQQIPNVHAPPVQAGVPATTSMLMPGFASPSLVMGAQHGQRDALDSNATEGYVRLESPSSPRIHRTVHFIDLVDELPAWLQEATGKPQVQPKKRVIEEEVEEERGAESEDNEELQQIPRAHIPQAQPKVRPAATPATIFPNSATQPQVWKSSSSIPQSKRVARYTPYSKTNAQNRQSRFGHAVGTGSLTSNTSS